jgi:hypothetical protein
MVLEDEASNDEVWIFPFFAVCLKAEGLNMLDYVDAMCLLSWHSVRFGRRRWS